MKHQGLEKFSNPYWTASQRSTSESSTSESSTSESSTSKKGGDFPVAEALRLLRTRAGLTQTAASMRHGAPDFRTLSHWETRRKLPSLKLLSRYLAALGLDFRDLQDGLDQITGLGVTAQRLVWQAAKMVQLERRLERLERLEDDPACGEEGAARCPS